MMVSGTTGNIVDMDWATNYYESGDVRMNSCPGFADDKIDELLQKGRTTLDEKRGKKYMISSGEGAGAFTVRVHQLQGSRYLQRLRTFHGFSEPGRHPDLSFRPYLTGYLCRRVIKVTVHTMLKYSMM